MSTAQVRDGMGQDRLLGAEAAQLQGMVDGVATLDEVVRKMLREARSSTTPRALRLAQAQRSLAILGAGG